jgi:hypothetical protein
MKKPKDKEEVFQSIEFTFICSNTDILASESSLGLPGLLLKQWHGALVSKE